MFKRNKKVITVLVCLLLSCLMTGCGFQIGSVKETQDYDDIFTDARAEDGKIYKHSMLTYNFSLGEYGEMLVHVDTTNGHKFQLIEGESAFQILDKDGETAVTALCMTREQYEQYSRGFTDKVKINGRDFYQAQNSYGAYNACSYMADCGLECGLALEAAEPKLFRLVGFGGTPLEGSRTDQDFYKGQAAPADNGTEETGAAPAADDTANGGKEEDLQCVTMQDGSRFTITGVKVIAIEDDGGYRLEENSVFVPNVYQDTDLYELADQLNDLMKEDSGTTPTMDIHNEGVYLTGIYRGFLNLTFLTEGENHLIYGLNLVTTNTDNSIEIINSIIDDFLKSGIAGQKGRTEYGEPVGGDAAGGESSSAGKEGSYYTVPEGYESIYVCEYFETYMSDTGNIMFRFDPQEELVDFVSGSSKTGSYLDMYKISKLADFESAYGKVTIIEAVNDDMDFYTYYAVSEDGTVCIDFDEFGKKMSKTDCLDLIKGCVK